MEVDTETVDQPKDRYSKEFKAKAGLFLAAVSGASAVFGFGATLASAKKRDPTYFGKGFIPTRELPETGASLALRALGWGTLYAVTGCGVLFYAIWKLSGAQTLKMSAISVLFSVQDWLSLLILIRKCSGVASIFFPSGHCMAALILGGTFLFYPIFAQVIIIIIKKQKGREVKN